MPLKLIIDEGPHYRYEADIWYLDKELKTNNNYEYCLDIIDHFSKLCKSYLLKNKEAFGILQYVKNFISIYITKLKKIAI